jgi:hypothetical protein
MESTTGEKVVQTAAAGDESIKSLLGKRTDKPVDIDKSDLIKEQDDDIIKKL